MRRFLAITAAFALAACAHNPIIEARDAVDNNRCTAMGYQPGTKLYLDCRAMLTQERTARRAANLGLAGQLIASQPQPVTCTSNTFMGTTTTNCR